MTPGLRAVCAVVEVSAGVASAVCFVVGAFHGVLHNTFAMTRDEVDDVLFARRGARRAMLRRFANSTVGRYWLLSFAFGLLAGVTSYVSSAF